MKKLINLAILFLIFTTGGNGQNANQKELSLAGQVVDVNNEPLPGVAIYVKDAPGVGTTSDINGKFSIKINYRQTVVFQMMGMKTVEKFIEKSDNKIKITLKEDSEVLEEVVVTGLTAQKKVSIVGAITNIDVGELTTPGTSINNMLGGRVAGIITQQFSGEPGKNISNFWIRGIGTFGANSSALVLIDGLEGNLSDIDPEDVQSFSILKDASATAVYGVRGANGVVLVTTKRGAEGKLQIRARATMQISRVKRMPEYLNAYEYAKLANEARAMSGDPDLFTPLQLDVIKSGLDADFYPDIDWKKEIMKPYSLQHRYYLSARGGGRIARYFLSVGAKQEFAAYNQDDTKFKRSVAYNQLTYRANIDMDLTKMTQLYFGVDGNITAHTLPGSQNTNSLWRSVRLITPIMFPVRYSDGSLPIYGRYGGVDLFSPYTELNYTGYTQKNNLRNMLTLRLVQKIGGVFKGLTFSTQVMSDIVTYTGESRYLHPDMYRATGRDAKGRLIKSLRLAEQSVRYSKASNHWRKYYMESKLNYTRAFDNHDLGALLFYYMEDVQDGRWTFDELGINSIPARRQNLSGRLSYGYNNCYFFDANFGYTGSSQFPKGKRFGFFPSIALGWVPSAYSWFGERLPWFSFLKIRGSYGLSGNDQISGNVRFPYLTLINNKTSAFWGYRDHGITEVKIGADNLKWEVSKKANIGIDAKFFKDKLSFTVDFFHDTRDNIFQQRYTLPSFLGLVTLPYSNVGRMHSYGSDGNVAFTHQINKDMGFTLRANYTFSQNMVDYFEENKLPYDYLSVSGKPWGLLRGYISEGLFSSRDDIATSPDQSAFGKIRPGDIKYRDVNGDGRINEDDKVPLSYGNQVPRFMGGIGGDFRWKDFSIGVLFKGAAKVKYYRAGMNLYNFGANAPGWIPFYSGDLGNVIKLANNPKNRWTPAWYSGTRETENPNAEFPRLSYGKNENNSQISTFWQRDGSYIRFQELNVRYKLRQLKLLKTLGLSSVDVEFVANNLFTIDKVKYFDPEQASFNGGVYPIPVTYTIQLYLNF